MNLDHHSTEPVWVLKIKALYDSLRSSEVRVVDYFLKHSEELVHQSVSVIAKKCQVSESTVVRTCQRLGFKGYQELRIAVAQEPLTKEKFLHDEIDVTDSLDVIADKVFRSNINALVSTRKFTDTVKVGQAVEAMLAANNVHIFAVGTSAPIATDFYNKLTRIGVVTNLCVDGYVQGILAANMNSSDVVIAISHSGDARDIVESIRIARGNGATTICITTFADSAITQYSDICLFISTQETRFRSEAITSRVAQLTMTDLLYAGIAVATSEQALRSMTLTESVIAEKKYKP